MLAAWSSRPHGPRCLKLGARVETACGLKLVLSPRACSLRPEAWSSYGEASCSMWDGARRRTLVFGVGDVGDRPVPACATGQALVALCTGRACVVIFIDDTAGPRPEGDWSLVDHM